MTQEQNARGRRYDPIPRGGQVGIDFEPTELFPTRELAAKSHVYPHENFFDLGLNIGRDLLRKRAQIEWRNDLSISLTYLFVKSVNDLLGAVCISKSGYPFQSWPLIRGGIEAAEVMDYLTRFPEYVDSWINKEKRFDSLSWLKNKLPGTDLRRTFFDTLNNLIHANVRPLDAFSTLRTGKEGARYLIVGPNPYPIEGSSPIDLASTLVSYPIRVLWQIDAGVMDRDWKIRFNKFDSEAKFPFGEAWGLDE